MSPERQHNPLNNPVAALAWALVKLRNEHGLSLSQMAPRAHFDKATLSRVTNGQTLPPPAHLEGYVRACGVDTEPWTALLEHARAAAPHGGQQALQDFAAALTQQCTTDLPQHAAQLGSAQSLATAWSHPTASSQDSGPQPGPAGGGGTPQERRPQGPSSTPEADTSRSKQHRRAGRQTLLTGSITCLACLTFLAGIGTWQLLHHGSTDDAHPSANPHPTTNSASPLPTINFNDESLKRLRQAQAGTVTWIIGVKREQVGLSKYIDNEKEWKGKEIQYAKDIANALKIKHVEFREVGTIRRAEELNKDIQEDDTIDMFVGTYGISKDRINGTDGDHPAVIFAGPYFSTTEKIMLPRWSKGSDAARINGRPEEVRSITDLPEDTRVCVVEGSTAQKYLNENLDKGKFKFPKKNIDARTDYDLCFNELGKSYDALLTDDAILQGFYEGSENEYLIADEPFLDHEEYGIGLNKNSHGLKREICRVMKENELAEKNYHDLKGGHPVSSQHLTQCDST